MTHLNTIADDAHASGILIHADDDAVTIRPEGGATAEADVTITANGMAHDINGEWPWVGTLDTYLSERKATRNWTRS